MALQKKSRRERYKVRDDMAGAEGLEPSRTVLETAMLPLHHAPKNANENSIPSPRAPVKQIPEYSDAGSHREFSARRIR